MKEVDPCARHTYVDVVRARARALRVTCDNVDIKISTSAHARDDIHQCYTLPLAVIQYS